MPAGPPAGSGSSFARSARRKGPFVAAIALAVVIGGRGGCALGPVALTLGPGSAFGAGFALS